MPGLIASYRLGLTPRCEPRRCCAATTAQVLRTLQACDRRATPAPLRYKRSDRVRLASHRRAPTARRPCLHRVARTGSSCATADRNSTSSDCVTQQTLPASGRLRPVGARVRLRQARRAEYLLDQCLHSRVCGGRPANKAAATLGIENSAAGRSPLATGKPLP